jgi:hypothetical protein
LHKTLFLEPMLQIVTNAGGGAVLPCLEAVAEVLCSHSSGRMPITAVRCGVTHEDKDWLPAELCAANRAILATRVAMGGGPLATALADGARIVVSGGYDRAAPFCAAAVARTACSWNHWPTLAPLAAASGATGAVVELQTDGSVELATESLAAITEQLRSQPADYADVQSDFSRVTPERTQRSTSRIAGCIGSPPTGRWNVHVTLDAGFAATAFLECSAEQGQQSHAELMKLFGSSITANRFLATDDPAAGVCLWRYVLCASTYDCCQEFLGLLQSMSIRYGGVQGAVPASLIEQLTETVVVPMDRDLVTVSVDTRPATEWL